MLYRENVRNITKYSVCLKLLFSHKMYYFNQKNKKNQEFINSSISSASTGTPAIKS
jgi:hypothetical protein